MNNNIMISMLKGIQKDYPLTNAEWQAIEQAKENAKSLPSVKPQEPKWIPVSERLPEKNDIYVVWTSKGFGNHLSTSYYSVDDGWTIEVCAWKENGEPYKAESEGQDE